MEILTKEALNELTQTTGSHLISLYMPTHRIGQERQQDKIRFKNLLSQAEEQLAELGMRKPNIEDYLAPAQDLQLDAAFWQRQSDGLALFIAPGFFKVYRLPAKFAQFLLIASRFHIKPLLPLLSKDGRFYVLAFSQKQIRLLEGSRYFIDEIDLEGVPTSLRQALWYDDPERQLQYHTGAATSGGRGAPKSIFHGQGVSKEDSKTDILRYFQQVDDGLMELLGDEQAPLVLAGVDYLVPIYRQANNYAYLTGESITGSPDELSAADLHKRAWEIVEPLFEADQHQALSRYRELSGSGSALASRHLETILPAAHFGRVDTLFVPLETQIWGSYNPSRNALQEHREFQPGDQDLLDLAVVQTLLNGGIVYALEPGNMPDKAPAAAIFRYTYTD